MEYAPELPFSGSSVNTAWAKANPEALERTLAALAKAVVWFQDSKNRGDAVAILAKTSKQKPEEVEKAYDFFNKGKFFEGAGKVSRKRLTALVSVLVSLGDIGSIGIDRLVLPGDARLVD